MVVLRFALFREAHGASHHKARGGEEASSHSRSRVRKLHTWSRRRILTSANLWAMVRGVEASTMRHPNMGVLDMTAVEDATRMGYHFYGDSGNTHAGVSKLARELTWSELV